MVTKKPSSRLRDFLDTFVNSIYSPSFYATVPLQSTSTATSYFLKLAVVLTVFLMLGSTDFLFGIVKFERNLPAVVTSLANNFPAELTITVKDGRASVNVLQPYFIPARPGVGNSAVKHYLVIDTKTPFSPERFSTYQSFAWLTRDTLFYYGNYPSQPTLGRSHVTVSDIRALPLSNLSDMTIDRRFVHRWLAMFEPWVRWLTPEFAALLITSMYVVVLSKLIYVFILAALVWVVAAVMRKNLDYMASYRSGLYAASLGFVLSGLAHIFKLPVPIFSVTLVSLLIVVVNLLRWPRVASR